MITSHEEEVWMRKRLLYVLEITGTELICLFTDDESRYVAQLTDLPVELQGKIKKGDFLFMHYEN